MTTAPTLTLNDGTELPSIGFGTYPHDGEDSAEPTRVALELGYRLLDTALRYENEEAVGRGVRESDVPRDQIVVTSKVPGRFHGYDEARESFERSNANLGLDTIDLFLIHWPLPKVGKYVDTWRALVDLQREGLVRSIGVSNFTPEHLERIIDATGVVPAVNQVELHPYFPQAELRAFHAEHGIVTQAWSPLGRGELLEDERVLAVANAHGVTPAQAILRWHVQIGSVPIPKSRSVERQRANLDVFGFELSDAEIDTLSSLERGRLWDQDPDTHEEF
ncbi:aldo/keto reductase [Pseudoclavibacter chungangensis]|uniref:Aldo/keto reductase n=1 Tax=Pseudoclavibacter chungangensis TaxID=587635 RepID=A0A7J5BNG4_9MICO|nr:aldo/keto reductase [Pseudoclavibacter chungangensis]KAB1653599.1 aldo/keto reductase [Pseudoclavibacter chungangensis]NYJ68701.1 diketogulonate reductase-like aldo/keto reductase [Pseudoclavibacter chungangensis]